MATAGLEAITSTTLTASAASITLSGIPSNYADLVIKVVAIGTSNGANVHLRVNGDSSSIYDRTIMSGYAGSKYGSTTAGGTQMYLMNYSWLNTVDPAHIGIELIDYSATDKHKEVISHSGMAKLSGVEKLVGRWGSTAAISSVTLTTGAGNFAAGTTVSIYGVVA